MRGPRSGRLGTVATSVLVLLLVASSCSPPGGGSPGQAIAPAAWNTPTPISAPGPNSNGAMARANVHGTGVFVTDGVRKMTGLRWTFKAEDTGSTRTLAVQGSLVCFAHGGHVYAVDAGNGTQKWHRELDNIATSAPAVAGDTLYVGGWEKLFALKADTGGVKWIFELGSGSDDSPLDDPVVEAGTVYFGGWNHFYALDGETGQQKWKVELSGVARSVPTVYDGIVYIGTFEPNIDLSADLHAFDSKSGQELWNLKATGGGIGGAVAVTGGVVYVSTRDDGLLALDAKTGQERWRYNPGSGLTTGPAVAYDTVYITNQGVLYAVDAQAGKEKWRLNGDSSFNSDPVIADGVVYFSTTSADLLGILLGGNASTQLHAVDAHNGRELSKFTVEGATSWAPAVADGTLYIGTDVGTLYAVK